MNDIATSPQKHSSEYIRGIIQAQAANFIPRPFEVDESNIEALNAVCEYFADSPEFEKRNESWSLKKGLFITGPTGTGKTLLMKCLRQNPKKSFNVISCRKIMSEFCTRGREVISEYSYPKKADNYNYRNDENHPANYFNHYSWGWVYDDWGAENIGTHFSDRTEVMEQVLLDLYERNLGENFQYSFFHITTNLKVDQIEARYGTRVKSRMREMFNIVPLTGEDRRR